MTETSTNGRKDPPDAGGHFEGAPGESHRPALEKLVSDLRDLEGELLDGFESREAVLLWLQKLAVRTLGQIHDEWYCRMSDGFTGGEGNQERVLMSILLAEQHRVRELDDDVVTETRQRISSMTVRPSLHRAVRHLRADAGEYVDDERGSTSRHDPNKQRYIAMRPALNELEGRQRGVLLRYLEGFDDTQALIEWTGDVEVATHGEIPQDWTARVVSEKSSRRLALETTTVAKHGRETVAANYLLPAFNAGARDLYGRSIENPDAESEGMEAPDWS